MGVREDCRHYLQRTTAGGEVMRRCRVAASEGPPFACPQGCLFFEERALSRVGWAKEADVPMTNTSVGLAGLAPKPDRAPRPPAKKGKKPKKGGKRR